MDNIKTLLQGLLIATVVGIVGTVILTGFVYLLLIIISNVFLGRAL